MIQILFDFSHRVLGEGTIEVPIAFSACPRLSLAFGCILRYFVRKVVL